MSELGVTDNKEKYYIVNLSDIKGRLDPYYYGHKFSEIEVILKTRKYVKFSHIIKSLTNGFDFRDYKEKGTPYLKVANIKKGYFDFSKIQYVDFNTDDINKNIKLKKGNLLLTRKGTFGNAMVLDKDYDYVISSEVFYIELINDVVIPKYLEIFFNTNIGQYQFDKNKIGAIMGSLSQEAIRSLIIPQPAIETQKQIIKIYEQAQNLKQQKELQAWKLLESIDAYLLSELGINLPIVDNSLSNRIFKTSLSKVSGGRFDPKLYDNNTKALRDSIANSSFPVAKLKEFIIQSVAGDWGEDIKEVLGEKYKKCLVIRATEFDNLYNLNLVNSRVKYRLIKKEKLEKIDIKLNDLLIEKSGGSPDQPVGRIAILYEEIFNDREICFSNFIHKIRVSSEISPDYLFCFLKTVHNIKLTDAMQSQTNGIRNLIMSNYFNQDIPVPPIEKQNKIAEHIGKIREQAKQLQKEAIEEFEKAKQEVEQIILGVNQN